MTAVNFPNFRLDGRRALVTGAGRGIGKAIAEAYAAAGVAVTLCARTGDEISAVANALRSEGLKADVLVADVTDIDAFEAHVAGRPAFDILVNNAGTNRPKPQLEVTAEDYDAVMNLNMRAAYFATQAVTRRMIAEERSGSVINMSSQMGHVGAANRTLYCASKWAIEGFTKALAVELGPHGIRINTICPTFIETPMTKPYFEDETFRASVLSKIKLGRLGQVGDVTGAAIFLASDASSLMTGSAVMLDGGWTAD
ncbi:SDR family NAD(P)-dependent oxidoreductase [Oricola nitratireducens]|uniref:SDR family NAD(P)-dependent oxidoreductase n=1 Tax=Oricola nitratireducens TaxID=2775868 RepID=UPI0018672843|nr:SDR family NAD(P)-dependent oxidoreductase [Oricola nitratireducens]